MTILATIDYPNQTYLPSSHQVVPKILDNNLNIAPIGWIDDDSIQGMQTYSDVRIVLTDVDGNAVNGNYASVTYQEVINGTTQPPVTVSIPGQFFMIAYNKKISDTNPATYYSYTAQIVGKVVENGDNYIPPGASDLIIQNVTIDKKESAAGAHDGQITINATTTYGPLLYSLDGSSFQSKATFTGLSGGGYTAYVKDAIPYSQRESYFNVPTIESLLVADSSATSKDGNTSRWSAAFNPVTFTYQRKDFGIANMFPEVGTNKLCITVNQNLTGLKEKDLIYAQAGFVNNQYAYQGVYEVKSVNQNTVVLNTDYSNPGNVIGYLNADKLRPYYHIQTNLSYQNKLSGRTETITAKHRPNNKGIVQADLSSFLQSLLSTQDDSDYTLVNFRDDNLSASYTISYAEAWDGHEPVFINISTPYYVIYSAKQLGEANGGNLLEYVPFKQTVSPSKRAKWITDFAEPAYSAGYPFDIGFIYSDDIAGLNVYCEITPLDINRSPLPDGVYTTYLLNEDSSFLLNQDSSRLVIAKQTVSNKPITQALAQHIGLNRLNINMPFNDEVRYFNLTLKYADDTGTHTITKPQTVRIDDAVDDQSVYLRWIGLTGSWNYYRFVYNQEISLDVQNAVIVKNYVQDWATQQGIEDVISKSAGQKMKVMAEDLSVSDIKGLQSIKYSPKVQMLVSKNPVRWQTVVLNTATFAEYETRNGQAPFSVTFNLPALNIQTQ
ncbi:hypothetical protein [Mucilaginibacter lacusdianchii]|uniref:hypothetical protein n=1 Tax=Mucilaginibacter lacusdianchii TaxID=2684211 RepID=UPI00131D2A32|nr:hypothetical protein [Mucilaginibacter sp. JXJ CY 39]